MKYDPRVDAYIDTSAPFAKPILQHLRAAVHAACPDAEEALKWSMPAFMYKGSMLANMAAFKAHATFGFWRASEILGETAGERDAMGQFGRIETIADLPDEATLAKLVHQAMALADAGPRKKAKAPPKASLATPEDLRAALDGNSKAAATFAALPPSAQRDYVEWVVEAKRPETRAKRIAQAAEWLAEGKRRNWKYESC